MRSLKLVLFCLIVFLGVSSYAKAAPLSQSYPPDLYVKPTATGTGDCSSWVDACGLQAALNLAEPGNEIWVAEGTYLPATTADRFATFQLKSGVEIFGGFPPTDGTLDNRDLSTHFSILSGDIGTPGDSTDNSYHVVTANGVTSTAILDGFTITAGNANGSDPDDRGGGMYNTINSSPTLRNLKFTSNSALVARAG